MIKTATIDKKLYSKKNQKSFPSWVYWLFYIFAAYMALPLIDVPLVGLSLSAPLFFFIAFYAIFKSPVGWFRTHRLWITIAIFIWLGTFLSATLNGLLSGGVNINSGGYLSIIRMAYWLLLFVVTIYFAGQYKVITRVAFILGIMAFVLGSLRWLEILFYSNYGAWSGTRWMSQNTYGFLFSTFSPFLLVFILHYNGKKRLFSGMALLSLWSAAAINGSRGSWVAIGVGLVIFLLVLFLTHSRKFLGIFVWLFLMVGLAVVLFTGIPQFSEAVINRFDTFNQLEQDKSYMIRQLMNQKALRLFSESPVIGVGPTRFRLTSTELDIPSVLNYGSQSYFDQKSAHNSYLAYLAETGLIGAIPFAILLMVLMIKGFTQIKWLTSKNQYWSLAIYLSFIQMSVHMWVITSLNNSGTWFIYGLTGAMIMHGYSLKAQETAIK
jgi:O-antigen ligase